jgi:primosomal protein N' (replication factor Y)
LAGHVVCNDCDQAVTCLTCQAPVVLHSPATTNATRASSPAQIDGRHGQGPQRNIFLCHACGAKRDAHETCTNCGGWNLVGLGLGIDRLEEEIKVHDPDISIYKISSDHSKSEKKIQEELKAWQNSGGVLLGTQMALPYLACRQAGVENTEISIIASLDSSLALPGFRMREILFRTILEIADKTTDKLIIQTRNPDNSIIPTIQKLDTGAFMAEEKENRQKFGYPPEKIMVKISTPKQEDASKIYSLLSSYEPVEYQSLDSRNKKLKNHNVLLKLSAKDWPDERLRNLLQSLPRDITYEINSDNIF